MDMHRSCTPISYGDLDKDESFFYNFQTPIDSNDSNGRNDDLPEEVIVMFTLADSNFF